MLNLPDLLRGSITGEYPEALGEIWLAEKSKTEHTCKPVCNCYSDDDDCASCDGDKEGQCTEGQTCTHDVPPEKHHQAFQPVVAGWSLPPAPAAR
jgi:hypothetical protein